MNPNLWQNRTGSETERGTSWEYEEQRGSELSAALGVQESFPHTAGTKAAQERAQAAPPAFHMEQFITSQWLHLQKCPAELTQKSQNCSRSSGFGSWTQSKAVESPCTSSVRVSSSLRAGRGLESPAREVSWVARGLFQRARIANWHCACIARGLPEPEHKMGQSSFFSSGSQEAQLSPNTLKIRAETSGC